MSILAPAVRLTYGVKQMRDVNRIKLPTMNCRSRRRMRQAGRVAGVGAVLASLLAIFMLSATADIVQNATDSLCSLLRQTSEGNLLISWRPAELQRCGLT